jgi:hypothetical protein
MEQLDIIAAEVVKKSLSYFYINPETGLVQLYPPLIKLLINNKQRAIIDGDWLLAYYPISERFAFIPAGKKLNLVPYNLPSYFVLVNLKTGKWTTDINNPFALHSPLKLLRQRLDKFYGHEMDVYTAKASR